MYSFAHGPLVSAFGFGPYGSMFGASAFLFIAVIVLTWTIILKGFALWYAARAGQKGWFIALLIVNTLGILEIVYLIWFRPKQSNPPAQPSSSAPTVS